MKTERTTTNQTRAMKCARYEYVTGCTMAEREGADYMRYCRDLEATLFSIWNHNGRLRHVVTSVKRHKNRDSSKREVTEFARPGRLRFDTCQT